MKIQKQIHHPFLIFLEDSYPNIFKKWWIFLSYNPFWFPKFGLNNPVLVSCWNLLTRLSIHCPLPSFFSLFQLLSSYFTINRSNRLQINPFLKLIRPQIISAIFIFQNVFRDACIRTSCNISVPVELLPLSNLFISHLFSWALYLLVLPEQHWGTLLALWQLWDSPC